MCELLLVEEMRRTEKVLVRLLGEMLSTEKWNGATPEKMQLIKKNVDCEATTRVDAHRGPRAESIMIENRLRQTSVFMRLSYFSAYIYIVEGGRERGRTAFILSDIGDSNGETLC